MKGDHGRGEGGWIVRRRHVQVVTSLSYANFRVVGPLRGTRIAIGRGRDRPLVIVAGAGRCKGNDERGRDDREPWVSEPEHEAVLRRIGILCKIAKNDLSGARPGDILNPMFS